MTAAVTSACPADVGHVEVPAAVYVSGLGLDAQRAAVEQHARAVGGNAVAEFRDIESGREANRSGLLAALAECRVRRATLLIAKLNRLALSVAFIANLMEGTVPFVVAEMPDVNRLTIHVLAAVAEHERKMIGRRTRAARRSPR